LFYIFPIVLAVLLLPVSGQYAGLLGYGFNLKTAEYVIPK
jgi:hypothetical protein